MKKTLAILCMLFITVMRAAAYEWTDGNGVTWKFDQGSFTINGTSQSLWYISGASGYGENVTVPQTVYNGTTACDVEGIQIYNYSDLGFPTGTNVTLPSTIKYINGVFSSYSSGSIKLNTTTPPTFGSGAIGGYSITLLVPPASLTTYREAWPSRAVNIISQSAKTTYNINSTAQSSTSGIHQLIGEDNLINVMSLTVIGSINSYDILMIRNKMHNLHYLDLTNANIVENSYPYYSNYPTTDNVLGKYTFFEMFKLISVKLPKSLNMIEESAFENCYCLKSIQLQNGLKTIDEEVFLKCYRLSDISIPESVNYLGKRLFYECKKLNSISIPEGVTTIEDQTFHDCSSLKAITFPSTLEVIADGIWSYSAFHNCVSLTSIFFPNKLEVIGNAAFYGCSSLKEVHLPSSIRRIGGQAFNNCYNLKDYYAYTIEPTTIAESTFSNWTTATLHIPLHAYNNYYWDTQWSKFYRLMQDNNYQYENFYLTRDYVFNDAVGAMNSTPNVQLDGGSGLIVETTKSTVKFDEVHMADNGTASASIIANNNLTVENLYFDMQVTKNKWYFVSFPFRVKLSNVTTPGNFVFRYYDGAERATNGKGGWKNVTGTYLNAHQGYIFQTNTTGTLTLKVEKADMNFAGGERQDALTTYTAQSTTNASWNFIGNPHSSYFDIDDTGYDAPITVWNGSTYQAVRAGDDQYHLSPFQAFFVQKPQGTASVRFPASGRHTYNQWADRVAGKQAAARANVAAGAMATRQIVNLTISNGEQTDDQTRVVFNAAKSTAYEMDCDAAKFFSDQPVAQLYTVDGEGTQYAINERPQGEVNIGFVAVKSGELQISAVRMDQPVYLRDNELNITHDLSLGGYTFTTSEGTNESRFTLLTENTLTGIAEVEDSQSTVRGSFYDLQGRRIVSPTLKKGAYIVKDGQKATKHLSK